jgi:hypothetical protein
VEALLEYYTLYFLTLGYCDWIGSEGSGARRTLAVEESSKYITVIEQPWRKEHKEKEISVQHTQRK